MIVYVYKYWSLLFESIGGWKGEILVKMRKLAVVLITSIFAFLSFGNNCIQADELTQGNIFGEQVSDPTEYNERIDEFIQKYSLDFMR